VNAKFHDLPPRVRLDSLPASRTGWKLAPDIAFPFAHHFLAPRWTVKGDGVEMLWSDGFQPTWIRATRQSNGDLAGEAEVGSDTNEFGRNPPRARVLARRTSCSASK
jgi:hypothetical protein